MYVIKEWYPKYKNNSYNLIIRKQTTWWVFFMDKRFGQTFWQRRYMNANLAQEKMLKIFSHRRNANTTPVRCSYTHTSMLKIKDWRCQMLTRIRSNWNSYSAIRSINDIVPLKSNLAVFFTKWNMCLQCDSMILILGI